MLEYRLAQYSLNDSDMKENWRWAEQGLIVDKDVVPISDLRAECIARRVPEVGLFEQLEIAWDPNEPRMAVAGVVGLLGELVALSAFRHLGYARYCVQHPTESNKMKSSDWLFSTYQDTTFLSVEVKAKGWRGATLGIGDVCRAFKQAGWGAEFDKPVLFRRMVAFVRLRPSPSTPSPSRRRKKGWNSDEWDIALLDLNTNPAGHHPLLRVPYPEDLEDEEDIELARRIGHHDPVLGHGLACWLGRESEYKGGPNLREMLQVFEGGLRAAYDTNVRMSEEFRKGVDLHGRSYKTALRQSSEQLPEGSIRIDNFRVLLPKTNRT